MSNFFKQDKSAFDALKLAAAGSKSTSDREKALKRVGVVCDAISSPQVRESFEKTANHLLMQKRMQELGQQGSAPLEHILTIGRFGLVRSAEFAWQQCLTDGTDFQANKILEIAPSIRFVDFALKKDKSLRTNLMRFLESNPEMLEKSATLDWLVAKGNPKELTAIASLLLSKRQRLPHLETSSILLQKAIERNKAGNLFSEFLRVGELRHEVHGILKELLRNDVKSLRNFYSRLPKLLKKPEAGPLLSLAADCLSLVFESPLKAREGLSAVLFFVVGAILQKPRRSENEEIFLQRVSAGILDWLQDGKETGSKASFWVPLLAESLVKTQSEQQQVTVIGARLVADSFEKARQGYGADSLFEALSANLGMQPLGLVGETVQFDFDYHQDMVGGLLSGAPAIISEHGWMLGETVIQRAKVKI